MISRAAKVWRQPGHDVGVGGAVQAEAHVAIRAGPRVGWWEALTAGHALAVRSLRVEARDAVFGHGGRVAGAEIVCHVLP